MNQNPFISILIFFLGISLSLFSKPNAILPASDLNVYGRYDIDANQSVELISSASHFGFSFKGNECKVYVYLANAGDHNYLQYVVDGVYQKKIRIDGNKIQPISITTTGIGMHSVWIYKATEAHSGAVFIQKITGKDLVSLKKKDSPLIEFIGNSITCGAAADPSETPCGSGDYHDQHNAYYAYGPRVARALDANFLISAVSGIGIYRNWNSLEPAMPKVYEKTDFQDFSTRKWNFEKYKPRVVSIALGTNDYSDGDGKTSRLPFDSTSFVNAYIKFIQNIKSKYPDAQIALLSSAMLNGKRMITLQNCLISVKSSIDGLFPKDKPVAVYFFKPMQPKGCGGHPSVEDHEILANELIPFFKKLLE